MWMRLVPWLLLPLLGHGTLPTSTAPALVPAPGEGPPSLVLITVDTLRRDHLGCYGYPRATSPVIDALAAESLVFDRAVATMATTVPSHLSMLTGLYAFQHGRTSNRVGVETPFTSGEGATSVARMLAGAGFRTAAFVSSRVLVETTGIGDGFQHYDCPRQAVNPADAGTTTGEVLRWLAEPAQVEAREPLFLWVHYWDTHEPNEPARVEFETDETLLTWIRGRGIEPAAIERRFGSDSTARANFFGDAGGAGTPAVDLEAVADLYNRYDSDLRNVDREIGRLFEGLRDHGLWDDAVVLFVADHGQSLGEDGHLGHGRISNVNTFVPLLLRFPERFGVTPRRVGTVVSLVDMMPTVLARLDLLPELARQASGADVLAPGFARAVVLTQEARRSGTRRRTDIANAVLSERWKLLVQGDGTGELYDLEGAGEGLDVAADHPDVVATLRAELERILSRTVATEVGTRASDEEVDELLEELRALGYVDD